MPLPFIPAVVAHANGGYIAITAAGKYIAGTLATTKFGAAWLGLLALL